MENAFAYLKVAVWKKWSFPRYSNFTTLLNVQTIVVVLFTDSNIEHELPRWMQQIYKINYEITCKHVTADLYFYYGTYGSIWTPKSCDKISSAKL